MGCGLLQILGHYFLVKQWFFPLSIQTWSNVYAKVIVPGRLTLWIRCENFLILPSHESLTQFYLKNLNWINRNLKFLCFTFEVCIKILNCSFKGNLYARVFSTLKKNRIVTNSNDFITCRTGTGKCHEKVCLAFSSLYISFPIFQPNFTFFFSLIFYYV